MAGVSFSLETLGRRGGYTGLLQKYGAAGLISCGPWLLSVFGMLFIGSGYGQFRQPPGNVLLAFKPRKQ